MLQRWFPQLVQAVRQGHPQLLVTVVHAQGSVPRDPGARMWVSLDHVVDTIGGGRLEWVAIERARHWLALGKVEPHIDPSAAGTAEALRGRVAGDPQGRCEIVRYPLGPRLGQCCGGVVYLLFEWLTPKDLSWLEPAARALAAGEHWQRRLPLHTVPQGIPATDVLCREHPTVVVCGAGHVGRAIVQLLGNLPFRVVWLDPRNEWPDSLPHNVTCLHGDATDVADCPDHAYWLVLTHNHALDLALVDAVLQHRQFRFLGMIGSDTKAARFRSQLARHHSVEQINQLHCPLGRLPTRSKLPEVIALSVVAQLLAVSGA